MRIVVLDGYTLNPGDLGWADLEAPGPLPSTTAPRRRKRPPEPPRPKSC